jgi:hypothetical protein
VPKKRLDVTQVSSALIEQERGGRMPKWMAEMTGTRARSQASLILALNAWLLKGAPSRPGKIKGDPAKSTAPPRSRTPFTLSRNANHSSSESDTSLVRGRSRKELPLTWRRAAIITPPGSRTLVKPATSEKERGGEMVCQVKMES